jgi:hypothetical protein
MAPVSSRAGIAASRARRRALRAIAVVLLADVALIASHAGEFWPFSSFSMFAGAGQPWDRALVQELNAPLTEGELRTEYGLNELPGVPLPLSPLGVPQHDLSSLVQRAELWNEADEAALLRLFGALPCEQPLLVLRVRGGLEAGRVEVRATPAALLSCTGARVDLRPLLPRKVT